MLGRMRRRFAWFLLMPLLYLGAQATAAEDAEKTPSEPEGIWRAELEQGSDKRLLVLTLQRATDGKLSGTLDGLGRDLRNLKVANLILVEDVLSFQLPQADTRFAGNFYGDSLRGTWSKGEVSLKVIFFRD
jgi:hypothetical protein